MFAQSRLGQSAYCHLCAVLQSSAGYRQEGVALKRMVIALVCATVVLSLASAAAGAIRIIKIQFNPPGPDTGSNAHLNKEWVKIRNTGNHSRSLTGWKLKESDGEWMFINVNLPAQTSLKIHTGSGLDSFPHDRYWGLDDYIWNNDADEAAIKKRNGSLADKCNYFGGGRAVIC
jgi:Lamin Tail Domain